MPSMTIGISLFQQKWPGFPFEDTEESPGLERRRGFSLIDDVHLLVDQCILPFDV